MSLEAVRKQFPLAVGGLSAPAPRKELQIDTTVVHSARFWNYLLGGRDNYAVDRKAADQILELIPSFRDTVRAERRFLIRAVQYLAGEARIRQFLDIGTGLPTADNTHQIAQRVAPECKIVYVDNDPLVLSHANALLASAPPGVTDYIEADVREPEIILNAAATTLTFTEPIALMLMGIMGHITDDTPAYSIVTRLLNGLPTGSFLVLRDATNTNPTFNEAQELYNSSGAVPYRLRSPEQIAKFFDTLELIDPGIVTPLQWRPETTTEPPLLDMACGVGYKK
jgi:hypothetical protein